MSGPRLLDLFCCQGGAAAGYAHAGFDVVGVDIEPQPRYPFEFHRGDALEFLSAHHGEFDAFHASPPCQDHSVSRHSAGRDHGTGWLLAATIEAFTALGKPWVVENVGGARMRAAVTLCGSVFGLGLHRHRRFETSFEVLSPGCDPSRIRYRGREGEVFGNHGNSDRVREEWAVPWMSRDGISQCIPPVFTEYLGEPLMAQVAAREAAA